VGMGPSMPMGLALALQHQVSDSQGCCGQSEPPTTHHVYLLTKESQPLVADPAPYARWSPSTSALLSTSPSHSLTRSGPSTFVAHKTPESRSMPSVFHAKTPEPAKPPTSGLPDPVLVSVVARNTTSLSHLAHLTHREPFKYSTRKDETWWDGTARCGESSPTSST